MRIPTLDEYRDGAKLLLAHALQWREALVPHLVLPCTIFLMWLMLIGVIWLFSKPKADRLSLVTLWAIIGPFYIPLWLLRPGNLVRILHWGCFRGQVVPDGELTIEPPPQRPMSYQEGAEEPVRRISI